MTEAEFDSINEIFENAMKVKGENFIKFVKFAGLLQGFCSITINRMRRAEVNERIIDNTAEDASKTCALLTYEFAQAMGLSEDDVVEALNMVDTIDDRAKAVLGINKH
jgi:hypothetical protein